MYNKGFLGIFLLSFYAVSVCNADVVAFPDAQGWGRWAKGARAVSNPTVYHVTNLNDSGTGSFRDAVSQPNRIVVFDVSGVINISSRIVFRNNLYIAGQTAPGEGVTIYGDGVSFSGADNLICRYLRVRMGHGGTSGKDCAGIANGTDMIFDHCSFSWGRDETFSINPDGKGDIGDITIQNTIIGQGLTPHSAGGLIQCDRITLYRNLYIDNTTRNNKIKGINQYANNVVYNWSDGCYIMGGESQGSSYANIQSNCFINGPGGGGNCFGGANADFHCYGVDNWQDSNKDGLYNPSEVTNYSASDHRTTDPYDYPELDLYPGNQLIEKNIPVVGASLPYRDQSDCYMIDELMSYGAKGAFIQNEDNLAIGVPSSWEWFTGTKPTDTDNDGMPDAWEDANGTDKNKDDATKLAANGYLNIENYINSITVEDRQYFLRKPVTLSLGSSTTSTMTLSWRDYTYAEEGFEVSYKLSTESEYKTVGTTEANATSFTITGLTDGTAYNVRVRAIGNNAGTIVYSGYASGTFKTRPIEAGIVDIDSYEADVTNSASVAEGQKLLLHSDDVLNVALESAISPSSVVVTGKGVITVSGQAINGASTSINKGDKGTLSLKSKNGYKGATVLHEGVLEFNSIANGDVASAIGASSEFSQNWIMDGGTYRYTGSNATTNRSAKLTNPTTLELASGSNITMNGTIEGDGDNQDFTLDGKGKLTVGTANLFGYTGTTTLKGGEMYLSSLAIAQAFVGNSSKLVMAGGKLSMPNQEGTGKVTNKGTIVAVEGTTSQIRPYRRDNFGYKFEGAGTIEWQIPYVREYFNCNVTEFTGKIIANGINSGALFVPTGSFNMPTTQVELKGTVIMCMWATNGDGKVGGISGDASARITGSSKQSDGVTCNWTVGGSNSDETYRGTIDNASCGGGHYNKAVNFNKVGTGLWRLTGTNKFQGAMNVQAGTLIINGTHSGNCGYANAVTSTYTVENEATLKGTGKIQKGTITVKAGGTIAAGDTLVSNKTFTLTGTTLNLQNGSYFTIPLYYNGIVKMSNSFTVGTMNINSGAILQIDMSNVTEKIAPDTKFTVLSGKTSINGTFSSVLPETPGEGLEWDLSELYTKGFIYVREANRETPTYEECNLFKETGKVDEEGYYWFNQANDAENQQLVANHIVTFDANDKAAFVSTYEMKDSQSTVLGTGAVKLSKASQVVFAAPAYIQKVKLALFRVSGDAWAQVYASTDSAEWVSLADIKASTYNLTSSAINYVDLSLEDMVDYEYRYIKVEQASSLTPSYLAGACITYMQQTTGIDNLNPDLDPNLNPNLNCIFDLQGRRMMDGQRGIQITNRKKSVLR